MLDFYFTYPKVLRRLRDGALGNEMDRIAAHFSDLGYNRASAKIYIGRLAKFSEFAARDARSARIDQDVVDRFLLSFRTESPRVSAATAIVHARKVAPERFSAPWRQADPDGPLLAAYQDHLLRVRGLEPKTCEGLLRSGRRILVWLRDNLPDQPLAKMTGEHVLALVQHFLSLTANDFHPIRGNVACSGIPSLPALVRAERPRSCPVRSADTVLALGALAAAAGMGGYSACD